MGYYDETDMTRYEKRKGSKKGYFFTGLVGAVIGAVAVTAAGVYMPGDEGVQNIQQSEGTVVPVVQNMKATDIAGMVEGAKDAVVSVMKYQSNDPFSNRTQAAGTGSGVIYKKVNNKALIVTNNHVVEGAKQLEVVLSTGKKLEAKLVGTDSWLDLAVLEVDGSEITKIATLGDSDKIRAGETAVAIGSPLGFAGTVTEGIISSKDREIPVDINEDGNPDWQAQVIQTDASINPGNSGGALLSANGAVIGINSSKIAQQEVEGIGFAIPVNVAKPVLESIEKYGKVQRPFMGIQLRSLDEISSYGLSQLNLPKDITGGVVVMAVTPDSPAAKAELKDLDVIVALDGQAISNAVQFRKHLYDKKKIGESMKVEFYRAGQKQEKTITLDVNAE
ncbi:S1C family serine protease [Ectobacillus sp. JY-23]|uniref:S1C family serine protease n=1 Tax=Ectobacillus sp. JY-23 TaxID=2933872 RepID=UPI001FF10F41|nr:S1C family serine protease [Ectobacillus sp. JY-23]UOY93223.1 S1C family serine protease [Ectobacillus sp. JY-23]